MTKKSKTLIVKSLLIIEKVYHDEVKDGGPAAFVPAAEDGGNLIQVVIEKRPLEGERGGEGKVTKKR